MIELFLTVLFLGSGSFAAFMAWRKLPLLLQVPEQLIEESFLTRPPRLKIYLNPILEYIRNERYRKHYRTILIWILHHLRLSLLRLERVVFRMLEALRSEGQYLSETEERYWSELKQWKQEKRENGTSLPEGVTRPDVPPAIREKVLPKTGKKV